MKTILAVLLLAGPALAAPAPKTSKEMRAKACVNLKAQRDKEAAASGPHHAVRLKRLDAQIRAHHCDAPAVPPPSTSTGTAR